MITPAVKKPMMVRYFLINKDKTPKIIFIGVINPRLQIPSMLVMSIMAMKVATITSVASVIHLPTMVIMTT